MRRRTTMGVVAGALDQAKAIADDSAARTVDDMIVAGFIPIGRNRVRCACGERMSERVEARRKHAAECDELRRLNSLANGAANRLRRNSYGLLG